MTESRTRRTGTAVQSLRAVAGSSELASAAPPPKAVAATASLPPKRQIDRAAILSVADNKMKHLIKNQEFVRATPLKHLIYVDTLVVQNYSSMPLLTYNY